MGRGFQFSTMYAWDMSVMQVLRMDQADEHLHAAVQLTLGLERPIRMGGPGVETVDGRCVLVAADLPHWFECEGWVAVIWLEPHCREARMLTERYLQGAPLVTLPEGPLEALVPRFEPMKEDALSDAEAQRLRAQLSTAWLGDAWREPPLHPAVRKVLRHIEGLDEMVISTEALAEVAGVSRSYLMQLFRKHLGTPVRRYLRWRRVWHAMDAILLHDASATEAAHRAGFHDLSHLTRVSKQLLDVSPGVVWERRSAIRFHRPTMPDP